MPNNPEVEFPPVSMAELRALAKEAMVTAKEASVSAKEATASAKEATVSAKEANAAAKEASAAVKETNATVKDLAKNDKTTRKRIEDAEKARGRAAETWFRKALPDALEKAGHKVDFVVPHRLRRKDREYDFVAVNGDSIFVGEVKVRFRTKHLSRLRDLASNFRKDYPHKAGDRKIYAIVCGMTVDEDAANLARDDGLLVAEAEGKTKILAKPRKMRDFRGG